MDQSFATRVPSRQERLERQRKMGVGKGTLGDERPATRQPAVQQAAEPTESEEEKRIKAWVQRQHELHPKLSIPKPAPKEEEDAPELAGSIPVEFIQNEVAMDYKVSLKEDILADKRSPKFVWPRQVAMYLAATMTKRSLLDIGRRFDKDHTTVLYAKNKIAWLVGRREGISENFREKENLPEEVDTKLAEEVARLEQTIRSKWDEKRAGG